ncbi:MAG: hypothetical protein HYV09_39720 [Deltaproteobacteria bacterium]|nr:hypothetical protein [Deltaproteobacteria bacterium]
MRRLWTCVLGAVIGCGGRQAAESEEPRGDAIADLGVDDGGAPDGSVPDDSIDSIDASAEDAKVDGRDAPASVDAGPLGNSVVVYSNNIENMIFDWKDLVHYMARDKRNPDLFLVQQMTNKKRLDELLAFMTATLGEKYAGIVAQDDPTHDRFGDEVKPNPPVTTGVIWRAARFDYLSHETWFPWGRAVDGVHTCDGRTPNSGYQTIRVRLQDTLAKKKVAVASLRHWTWMDCSQQNMIEMIDGVATGPGAHAAMPDFPLQIVGGDFNGPAFDDGGDYRCWYRVTNHALGGAACAGHANLGFADPLYEECKGATACVRADSGIDFIFGRTTGGKPARSADFRVITYAAGDDADKAATGSDSLSNRVATHGFDDVNSNYSGHRARRAIFFYE